VEELLRTRGRASSSILGSHGGLYALGSTAKLTAGGEEVSASGAVIGQGST
jgi:hypothetical protein